MELVRPFTLASLLLLMQAGCSGRAVDPAPPVPRAGAATADTTRPLVVVDTEESLWPDPVERTHVRLSSLQYRIEGYRLRTRRFPTSLEEVFPDSVERAELARDAWGGTIDFRPLPNDYELKSRGPDREFGTPDDLLATSTSEMPVFLRPPGQRTQTILESLQIFITVFHSRRGTLPDRLEDLSAAGFHAYLGTVDEWQRPIVYTRTHDGFEVRSAGADGAMNTPDDIVRSGAHPALRKS